MKVTENIATEDQTRQTMLLSIRNDDKVWIEYRVNRNKTERVVRNVVHVTPSRIITNDRFQYHRATGMPYSGHTRWLIGHATPADVAEWERKHNKIANMRRAHEQSMEQARQHRLQLAALFAPLECFLENNGKGTFALTFTSLTAQQIRAMATALKGAEL